MKWNGMNGYSQQDTTGAWAKNKYRKTVGIAHKTTDITEKEK